jgi:predicted HTH domain antitoxin
VEVDLNITENMKYVVETLAKEEHIDEKTALRKLLYEGIKPYVLNLYAKGKISLSKTAEILNLSVSEVLSLGKTYGLEIGSTAEQAKESRKHARELIK